MRPDTGPPFIFSNILYLHVYCYAPTYQVKFLVCENLLCNKTDSDENTISQVNVQRSALHSPKKKRLILIFTTSVCHNYDLLSHKYKKRPHNYVFRTS